MSWKHPKTWLPEKITADKLNEEIRDNFEALKYPPTDIADFSYTGSLFTATASTSWVVLSDYSVEIETNGGDILISFQAYTNRQAYIDIAVNGQRLGGNDGLQGTDNSSGDELAIYILLTDREPGVYTIELYGKATSGGGFGFLALHVPQLFAREVS